MRATRARCALGGPIAAALLAAGCLEIPAHAVNDAAIDAADCAGPADDCDDDGWPATSRQAAGADCDDRDPAINPGAFDDPETAADEDCLPDGAAQRLIGVTGNQAGWTSGDLSLAFATMTRMPSSLRIGAVEALASESACEVSDEEGLGVSLYPAFAAHLRTTTPVGDNPVERAGPAMATSLVTWEVTIPSSGSPRCDAATTLTASIRFTVLPGQRLIREDILEVDAAVTSCAGCANQTGGLPILSSYLALPPSFDRALVNSDGEAAFPSPTRALPAGGQRVCVRQSAGPGHLAITWSGSGDGIRLRGTGGGNRALVYDLVSLREVAAMNHVAVTSMVVDSSPVGPCPLELQDAITELAQPPIIDELTFRPGLGAYEPTDAADATDGAVSFLALATIDRGLAVRVPGLGDRGVTVWRDPVDGPLTRLSRDFHYLVQLDADGATVVYLPSLLIGDRVTIAGPGREPAP
jgi:hypothetical protein